MDHALVPAVMPLTYGSRSGRELRGRTFKKILSKFRDRVHAAESVAG
jgi:hypothetical protein